MKQDMYTYHYYRRRSMPPRNRYAKAAVAATVLFSLGYSSMLLLSLLRG